jgi:GNAT superfamily N-acetyltransferase
VPAKAPEKALFEVEVNPHGIDEQYLHGLRTGFAGVWDVDSYRWYHTRPFASKRPDVFAVRQDGQVVAGMGLNYRQLRLPSRRVVDVGVFTAAWALPEHRGKWHFLRLINAARIRARQLGCLATLSFVAADNASARVLERAGAYSVAAHYLLVHPGAPLVVPGEPLAIRPQRRLNGPFRSERHIQFHYPDVADWSDQILGRPWPTSSLGVGNTAAVVERAEATDRLQYVSDTREYARVVTALALESQRSDRSFFHFTMSTAVADAVGAIGMLVKSGRVMILDLDAAADVSRELKTAQWLLQAGERM